MALTSKNTIADWLAHPLGGPLVRELLARAGTDESALTVVAQLPLQQLVAMSNGQLPQDVVDDLVRRADDGTATVDAEGWTERIVSGRFAGRTVIVTGAAGGIGRATASRIAREGGRVIAVDIAADRLKDIDAETVVADLTDPADIDRIIEAAGPRIDGLANVAGIADDNSPVHETSDELWQRVFDVNLNGLFRLTRAVLPAMLAAGRGSVVNVASEAALRGSAAGVAYTASKHAVVGLTRSAAFMYAPHGIRVNAVAPGGVATGMPLSPNMNEFGQDRIRPHLALIPPIAVAEHLAASITFLLSDDGVNINGAVLPSDGGWSVQ